MAGTYSGVIARHTTTDSMHITVTLTEDTGSVAEKSAFKMHVETHKSTDGFWTASFTERVACYTQDLILMQTEDSNKVDPRVDVNYLSPGTTNSMTFPDGAILVSEKDPGNDNFFGYLVRQK